MENYMNFGEVLQTKRKSMGLTQEDLADKLFVSSKTISNWETNKKYYSEQYCHKSYTK